MKYRFIFALALGLAPSALTARRQAPTAQEINERFAPHVMPDGETKQFCDEIFCDAELCDALFGPIEYKHLKETKKLLWERGNLQLCDYGRKLISHPKLPHLLIKCGRDRNDRALYDNISRVSEAKKMGDFLQENGTEDIKIPKKWLYHLPGHDEDFCDANYVVVVERLDVLHGEENTQLLWNLPLDHARTLLDFLIEMRYPDMSDHNIFFLQDKETIAIVDTEEWRWARDPNWCAKRFMTIVNPETVAEILAEEFCAKHSLATFEVLFQELQDGK